MVQDSTNARKLNHSIAKPYPLWAQMAEPPDPFLSCIRTARARTNDAQVSQDDIVTQKISNKTVLREIDFHHDKEALIFNQGA